MGRHKRFKIQVVAYVTGNWVLAGLPLYSWTHFMRDVPYTVKTVADNSPFLCVNTT